MRDFQSSRSLSLLYSFLMIDSNKTAIENHYSELKQLVQTAQNQADSAYSIAYGKSSILKGSYTGTGVSGPSHKNSLYISKAWCFISIYQVESTKTSTSLLLFFSDGSSPWKRGATASRNYNNRLDTFDGSEILMEKTGNYIYWYSESGDAFADFGPYAQLNASGVQYRWFALCL